MSHTHKHFVALPIALAMALVLGFAGAGQRVLFASVQMEPFETITAPDADTAKVIDGQQMMLFKGAVLEKWNSALFLRQGSVLIGGEGIVDLRAERTEIHGLHGAFYASLNDGKLTVAAITTPVSVRLGWEHVAVPTGSQWSAKTDSSLSPRDAGLGSWLLARKTQLLPPAFLQQMQQQWDTISAQKTSTLPSASSFLSWFWPSVSPQEKLPPERLLGDAAGHPDALSQLLPALDGRTDIAVLTALHPDYRTAAWSLFPADDAGSDSALLSLVTLPLSDTGEEPLSDVLFQSWKNRLQITLTALTPLDRTALTDALTEEFVSLVDRFRSQGYPERAQRYTQLAVTTLVMAPKEASPESAHMVANLLAQASMPTQPADPAPTATVQHASSASSVAFDGERTTQEAKKLLTTAGALFSVKTTVNPTAPHQVTIDGILFASSKGDRAYSFILDTDTQQVSSVFADGKQLPYALSFEQFVHWAKGL